MPGKKNKKTPWPLPFSKKSVLHSFDPLGETFEGGIIELSEKTHEKAEKPIKLPKKTRGSAKESYFPMHGGRK